MATRDLGQARDIIWAWRGYPLVGTPEQVDQGPRRARPAGMEGMVFGLVDYDEEQLRQY
jgi:hypothetical protein